MQEISSYGVFLSQLPNLFEEYPTLASSQANDGRIFANGHINVIDSEGRKWDAFEIEIHHAEGFPFRFPVVYETGGKIPQIADWHINLDKTCCLTVPPIEELECRKGITLTSFVGDHVHPYFFNQAHRRLEGFYKNGEYSHGILGLYEFFDCELKTNGDVRKTIELVIIIANGIKPGRTHDCICGRKEKFRKCHRDAFERLEQLGKEKLKDYASTFARSAQYTDLYRFVDKI